MNYIELKMILLVREYLSLEMQELVKDIHNDNNKLEIEPLRELYKNDRKLFIDIINELKLRGAYFVLESFNPIFNNIDLTSNEYIYAPNNDERYKKLHFNNFGIVELIKKYNIKDDRFFCGIPLDGFRTFNKSFEIEKLKQHFIECGYEILTEEEIMNRLLDKYRQARYKESIEEKCQKKIYIFPEKIRKIPVNQVFSDSKEAKFISFCETYKIEYIEEITPEVLEGFRKHRGVGETKYLNIYTKVKELMCSTYVMETPPIDTVWDDIQKYDLENKKIDELYEGVFLQYCNLNDKYYLKDIKVEILEGFSGIQGIGKIKQESYKRILIDYIEKKKRQCEMLEGYVVSITEDKFELIKNKSIKEVEEILYLGIDINEELTMYELQGKRISEIIKSPEEQVKIVKCIDAINQIKVVNELFEGARTKLSEKEFGIVKNRYTLGYTLEECGRLLKLTRERVRQIEKKAIDKIIKYLKENQILVCMKFQFAFKKYISLDKLLDAIAIENMPLAQAYLLNQKDFEKIDALDILCLCEEQKLKQLCIEIEEYLDETIRIDEEEDLLIEMFQDIGIENIGGEEIQKYLINIGYRNMGYFYSKHKLSLVEMYTLVLRDELNKPLVLDSIGAQFMKKKVKELFYQDITAEARPIEARIVDSADILNVGSKTYIHRNHINISEDMVKRVEQIIKQELRNKKVILSAEVFRAYQSELEQCGIDSKYIFYMIAKNYLLEEYSFGNGNTMSITRANDENGFRQSREEILIEKLSYSKGYMKKIEALKMTQWESYKLDDIVSKSNRIIYIGKSIVDLEQNIINNQVQQVITECVQHCYEYEEFVVTQRIYKETIIIPEVYKLYEMLGVRDGRDIAAYIKHLFPNLKGHSNILVTENAEVNNIYDVLLRKFDKCCAKGDIQEYLSKCGYKEATRYIILNRLINDQIYYQVDNNNLITKQEFEMIYRENHEKVKQIIDEKMKDKAYLVIDNELSSLRRILPKISYRWSAKLILGIIQFQGYTSVQKECTDYRIDKDIIVREDSAIKTFDQLVKFVLEEGYTGIMHETYIKEYLMEKGILYKNAKSRKLPYEIYNSSLFEIDEVGRVVIK